MYKIYGTPTCGYCRQAKDLLESKSIEYDYIDLSEIDRDEQMRLMRVAKVQFRTVPQIFTVEEEYIGGYTDLVAHLG